MECARTVIQGCAKGHAYSQGHGGTSSVGRFCCACSPLRLGQAPCSRQRKGAGRGYVVRLPPRARRLVEGAGPSVEMPAATWVLSNKTYDPVETAPFGIDLRGDVMSQKPMCSREPASIDGGSPAGPCRMCAAALVHFDEKPRCRAGAEDLNPAARSASVASSRFTARARWERPAGPLPLRRSDTPSSACTRSS